MTFGSADSKPLTQLHRVTSQKT